MKTITASIVAATAGAALAAPTVVQSFDLFDHPSGAVSPQAYGLRFDTFPDGSGDDPATFSFEDANTGASNVRLDVIEDNGVTSLQITGTIWGNSANNGTDYGVFDLSVIYNDVTVVADGWVFTAEETVGTITETAGTTAAGQLDGDSFTFMSKSNGSFSFALRDDGHRLSTSDGWVGRGWNDPNPDSFANNTYDFLFTATPGGGFPPPIPLPTASAMGLAGLGLISVRRRR